MGKVSDVITCIWRFVGRVFFRAFIYLVGAVTAVLLGLWVADRGVTVQVVTAEAPKPVRPGGQLEVRYRVNRFRACDRKVFRELVDGERYRHILGVQSPATAGAMGFDEYTVLVAVPIVAQPGLGEYRVVIEDYCNPLHYLWPLVTTVRIPISIAVLPGAASERMQPDPPR